MIIPDPLFGPIQIPDWLQPTISAPEVQRLREIRLINVTTPSLPALSDTRRFTHTLGVLNLCLRAIPRLRERYRHDEWRALTVAAVLHDCGSPPFGHLFEYLLKAKSGWTHEAALGDLIRGSYRPEGVHHQIYFGSGLKLESVLAAANIDVDLVTSNVLGRGRLGPLLAGSIDFDNIDNVFRMATMLGLQPEIKNALQLSDSIATDEDGLVLDEIGLGSLQTWRDARRRCYEILAFNPDAVRGQAMLTDVLSSAMQAELLGEEHWWMTDEQLLRFLLERTTGSSASLKETVKRFAIGDFFSTIFMGWFNGTGTPQDLRKVECREELRASLEERLKIPCCPYVFYDKGTFEKSLDLRVASHAYPNRSEGQSIGLTSKSTIVGIFTPRRIAAASRLQTSRVMEVLEDFGLRAASLRPIPKEHRIYGLVGQEEFDC